MEIGKSGRTRLALGCGDHARQHRKAAAGLGFTLVVVERASPCQHVQTDQHVLENDSAISAGVKIPARVLQAYYELMTRLSWRSQGAALAVLGRHGGDQPLRKGHGLIAAGRQGKAFPSFLYSSRREVSQPTHSRLVRIEARNAPCRARGISRARGKLAPIRFLPFGCLEFPHANLYRRVMDSIARTPRSGSSFSKSSTTSRQSETDDNDVRTGPRYAAIKQSICDAVRDGLLKPGDRVPSEAELVQQFDVSRMTANRALRELQASGVLVRRAGSGSFIAEPKPIGQMIEIRNIADEVRARGHVYRARVVQNIEIRASADMAALLEVPVGTKLFHSIIVHHEAEFPIQLEERFVLASAAPDYGKMDFTQTTPNEYLTRTAPLERVEHRVRAEMPDAQTHTMLGLANGEPVLRMTRRTWSHSRLVSHAWLTHPGSRFELSAAFAIDG